MWVSTLTLSVDTLTQHQDEWKVKLALREPKSKELNHPHFTLIKITDLNFSFGTTSEGESDDEKGKKFDEGVDYLRKTLGHIYYYYINPKDKPNYQKDEEKEEEEEEEEGPKKKKGKASQKKKQKLTPKGKNKIAYIVIFI